DNERIKKQIRSAVTDSGEPTTSMSPGVENLLLILRVSGAEESFQALSKDWEEGVLKYKDLKEEVSAALLQYLEPVQERYREIIKDKRKYRDQIKESTLEIRKKAQETLKEV